MSDMKEASGLHKQAATDHETAAANHRKAADRHDNNQHGDAKTISKTALDNSNAAQKNSVSACGCSAK
jgi:hypothetical protein